MQCKMKKWSRLSWNFGSQMRTGQNAWHVVHYCNVVALFSVYSAWHAKLNCCSSDISGSLAGLVQAEVAGFEYHSKFAHSPNCSHCDAACQRNAAATLDRRSMNMLPGMQTLCLLVDPTMNSKWPFWDEVLLQCEESRGARNGAAHARQASTRPHSHDDVA